MSTERLQSTIDVTHDAAVTEARAEARRLGLALGWPEHAVEELAICASELCRNITDHGGGIGTLYIEADPTQGDIRLLAHDRGPGIDVARAAALPATFGGGEGLATLGRLMDIVEISVQSGTGARVSARKWAGILAPPKPPKVVLVHRPHPREQVNGDVAVVERSGAKLRLAVIDGLGHGQQAREAAQRAADVLVATVPGELLPSVDKAHASVAGTRGAAMAAIDIDWSTGKLRSTVVGNVRATAFGDNGWRWSALGVDAVLGQGRAASRGALSLRMDEIAWAPDRVLAIHSDGLSSRFSLDGAVRSVQASLVRTALGIFARQALPTDDATLILAG